MYLKKHKPTVQVMPKKMDFAQNLLYMYKTENEKNGVCIRGVWKFFALIVKQMNLRVPAGSEGPEQTAWCVVSGLHPHNVLWFSRGAQISIDMR